MNRDLYTVLGVSKSASAADLKKAYRTLAQQHHPDKNPGDKAAEEKFKEAANAYQILSDADKRAAYDRFGFDGLRTGGDPGPQPGGPFPNGFRNVEDVFSAFGDLFGDFFAGRGRGGQGMGPRGNDVRIDLPLTFAESVWGTRKTVDITRPVSCTPCRGTGATSGAKVEVCRGCHGKGSISHMQGFFMVQSTCSVCHGVGRQVKDPCGECRGQGVRTETSTITVTVPAGIHDEQTLRIAGKGEGIANGTSGDLFVQAVVDEDERFDREVDGFDVTSEVPISFFQAVLGGEVEIDTLDDECKGTVILELRPGTQSGEEVVRRGQGIPHLNSHGRGDHYVRFVVEVPKKLTAKQEKLLREVAEELGDLKPKKRRSKSS